MRFRLPWSREPAPLVQGTGDDAAYCGLCGKETSVAMIAHHLVAVHGIDPDDIATAPVIDSTDSGAAS